MNTLIKIAVLSTLILSLLACTSTKTIDKASSVCYYGMSHNDYEQKEPLLDALKNGINCVEVDLVLKDGTVCVAHTEEEVLLEKTLENLYLAPLKKIIDENNGSVYNKTKPFYIYLDIKSENEIMPYLTKVLDKYSDILTSVDAKGYHPAPIKVIGGKWKNVKEQTKRYLFAEGEAEFLDSELAASSVFIVNNKWSNFFKWTGEGEMPIGEELLLREMVYKAHKKGRIIRFWNQEKIEAGENLHAYWNKLLECGVDLISTDDLVGLNQFYQKNKNEISSVADPKLVEAKISPEGVEIYFDNKKRLASGKHNLNEAPNGTIKSIALSNNVVAIVGDPSKSKSDEYTLFFSSVPNLKEGVASALFGDWESWTKPVAFKTITEFPKEKVEFSLWQYTDNLYAVMVPLCDNNHISMLGQSADGIGAIARNYSPNDSDKVPFMIVGFDSDPYRLIKDVYKELMAFMDKDGNLREHKDYPSAFEGLTWCTWNAMYDKVSEAKISKGIETFYKKGVTIPTLLIDDGWSEISDDKKLVSYKFDKKKFPNGSKYVFDNLKKKYGVNDIGVWHTMNGYWAGIDPKSELYKEEKENLIAHKDKVSVHDTEWYKDPYYAPSPKADKAYKFYDKWYSYLKEQGVSFVKVDQQSIIKRMSKGSLDPSLTYGEIAMNMEQGLQAAVRKHFSGQIINCQDMATEALYNMGSSAVVRNSDDYFPERTAYYSWENEKGNAAVHVIMNIHNAMWTSEIAWPDYDMFQSHHIDAAYHATLRTISGGPIFLTDIPGKQNIDLVKKLCLTNGEILRVENPGKLTEDCLFNINVSEPLKAFSTDNNGGLLGIWNTDDKDQVLGSWSVSDLVGLEGDKFIAYEHVSNKYLFVDKVEEVPVKLGRMGYEYWNIVPLKNNCAVIGLVNKYNAVCAVSASVIRSNSIQLKLRDGGELAVTIPNKPKEVLINGKLAEKNWSYTDKILLVDIDTSEKDVTVAINY